MLCERQKTLSLGRDRHAPEPVVIPGGRFACLAVGLCRAVMRASEVLGKRQQAPKTRKFVPSSPTSAVAWLRDPSANPDPAPDLAPGPALDPVGAQIRHFISIRVGFSTE